MKVINSYRETFCSEQLFEGIRKEIEGAGHDLVLLEKYTDRSELLAAVKDADANDSSIG